MVRASTNDRHIPRSSQIMSAGHMPRLRAGHVKRLYRLCSNSSPQTTDTVLTRHCQYYNCLDRNQTILKSALLAAIACYSVRTVITSVQPRWAQSRPGRAALQRSQPVTQTLKAHTRSHEYTFSAFFTKICTTRINLNRAPFRVH